MTLGLLATVPVAFLRSVEHSFVAPKAALVVVGGLLLGAVAVATRVTGSGPALPRAVALAVVALVGWTAVAAATSPWPDNAFFGDPSSRHGLLQILAFAGVLAGVAATARPGDARRALGVLWFGAGGVVIGYGALQLHDRLTTWGGKWDPVDWPASRFPRAIWSTFGNPDDLAGFLAMLLPVGLVLTLSETAPWRRRAGAVLLGALLVELAVTSGRAAWLGAAAAVVVLAASRGVPVLRGRRGVALLVAAGMGVAALAVGLSAAGRAKHEVGDLLAVGPGSTIDVRRELWRAAAQVATDRPLVGVGPDAFAHAFFEYRSGSFVRNYGAFTTATDPHNVLATWLAVAGVPGLAAFVGVLAAVAHGIRRRPAFGGEVALRAALVAALVAWFVQSLGHRQSVALDLCAFALAGLAVAPKAWRAAPTPSGEGPAQVEEPAGLGSRYQP